MKLQPLIAGACLVLGACVENKEEIVVQRDGSVHVRVSAKGDSKDLVDGFALPLSAPWRTEDEFTASWIAGLGLDLSSASIARAVASGAWPPPQSGDVQLVVGAYWPSVADLPRSYAPSNEPYRSAYLERETRLAVERRGSRTVYSFERSYGARRWSDRAVLAQLEDKLPEDVQALVAEGAPLSDEQWRATSSIVIADYQLSALSFAREALTSVYREGDADLPTDTLAAALQATAAAIAERIDEAKLREVYAALTGPNAESLSQDAALNPDLIAREAVRDALKASLSAARIATTTQNAIAARLEHAFTAFDATVDSSDEKFVVEVELPGVVVDGNYDELDGARARWYFEGEALRDRSIELRATSVLE